MDFVAIHCVILPLRTKKMRVDQISTAYYVVILMGDIRFLPTTRRGAEQSIFQVSLTTERKKSLLKNSSPNVRL